MIRLAAATLLCAAALAQEPVFKVEVNLVRVLATVKDSSGQLVGGLEKKDFTILDSGVEQQVAVFERHTEQPLSVAVLIDTSLSTAIELKYELESVGRFLKALVREGNPQDAAALYSFNYSVSKWGSYTRRVEHLEHILKELKPEGGTSLYDAISLASEDLEDRDGRHVVVVITDGGDTSSRYDYHRALKAAQMADAVIYAILVMPITNDAGRNIGGENALAGLTASTGGRVFYPSVGPTLDTAFGDILRDLRTQYLLGFYPRNVASLKDGFHKLDIRVAGTGLRVLARNGYYEDSASGQGWKTVR